MEEPPLMETVYEAINALYNNPDTEKRNEANRWLIDLQKSVYAWKVADELLRRQMDLNSCYLGAQMIRTKIMTSFNELPHDAVLSLHNSLMQHLKEITKDTEAIIVTTQLCVSVVDLSLQMNTWNNPIHSFLSQREVIPHVILLDILKVFPEEVDTKSIRLGSNRRNEVENELSNCAGLLNDYLNKVISEDTSQETLLKAIQCFTSWINIVRNLTDILEECDLIPKVFQILNPVDPALQTNSSIESRLHDVATELLCSVLRALRGPDADRFLDVNLYAKIAAFELAYHNSVASESIEKAINYCQIFSELGDAFMIKMVNETKPGNPHFSLQILDLILTCVGHHDYEVSAFTFGFWFSLAELLYGKDDDSLSVEFKPYINRLLTALCRQVQMEPDYDGLLEESDDFKIFRDKVCDLVRDSIFIVGSTDTFCQIFSSIQNSSLSWDQLEANLFIMYSIAWRISPHESSVVPLTVQNIFKLPESVHVAVKYTAILILGELRDWFDEHPIEYLISALQYLEINLCIKELAEVAASSLCLICCTAKRKLKDQFSPLQNIISRHALDINSNKAAVNIIRGAITVMCQLPMEEIRTALKEICRYHTKPLLEILHNRLANGMMVEKKSITDVVSLLDRLAAVFRFVQQPCTNDINDVRVASADAFSETQPILFQIMDVYQKDLVIMERCCRCIRFAIRALGKIGEFLIEPLVQKLVELYRGNGHSCFLYVGSILVDEFGNDSSNWDLLLQMVDAFIGPTFSLLQDANGFRAHPDTIDDLFRLCSRILQRLPIAFLRSEGVISLIECGLVAISVEHREANASVMKFFHEIFDCTATEDQTKSIVKREMVQHLYQKHGEALVRNLLHASVLILPSYTLVNIAEILHDLIQFDNKVTLKWIELAVQQLPNQSSMGCLMASPEQIQTFLNSCEQASKMRDISRALRDFTLYYR